VHNNYFRNQRGVQRLDYVLKSTYLWHTAVYLHVSFVFSWTCE